MIRIRDISLPPQQDMSQLVFAAARQLRIDHTQIKRLAASDLSDYYPFRSHSKR